MTQDNGASNPIDDIKLGAAEDVVNQPKHYTSHPSGIECIEISKYLSGCLAQAFQYVWRCGQKDDPVQELRKAIWFIDAELSIDDFQFAHAEKIHELLNKVCDYEPINRHLALARIALSNANYRGVAARRIELKEAKEYINNLIYGYK